MNFNFKSYDCDRQWEELVSSSPAVGALPRLTKYGENPDLIPYGEAEIDNLVDPKDYDEVIADCHERQIFPMYHQKDTWGQDGFQWDQNGLSYCWTWGLSGNVMDTEAKEGKWVDGELLSPVSLGWLVNWQNRGNYLESAIGGARSRGICEMSYTPDMHSRSYRSFKDGWEENALTHRLDEVWDLDNSRKSKMVQHSVSALASGAAIYIAYNWWSHALSCVGVIADSTKPYGVEWILRNSHNESDFIKLSGDKGVFSEAYAIRSTKA